jgi:hypothetical protein
LDVSQRVCRILKDREDVYAWEKNASTPHEEATTSPSKNVPTTSTSAPVQTQTSVSQARNNFGKCCVCSTTLFYPAGNSFFNT